MAKPQPQSEFQPFFEIRGHSIVAGRPLPFDLYLYFSGKPLLFRQRGDTITADRLKSLNDHAHTKLLIPSDQRHLYLESLKNIIHDPDAGTDTKSKFIKESAFVHLHDLFTKQDLQPVVEAAKSLIEDMVSFVSTDI